MNFKSFSLLTLLFIPCWILAQTQTSSILYAIYQKKNDSNLFKAIDEIKKTKKEKIIIRIKELSAGARAEIIRNADAAAKLPWTILTLSEFNEFKVTGNRVNYENNYFSRRNKLNTLIIGELLANDGRYLKDIVNGVGLICEESTWALPAHMSLQKAGNGLPDANEPIIDLFAGQTAMILAHAKYLLRDELTAYSPVLMRRVDSELKKRIFDPYLHRDDFWWMGFNTDRKMNNWNIFINTNVLSSIILGQDDPDLRHSMIEKSIRSVDHFLASYPADGGCDEGPSYWGMAGGQLIEYIDMLSVFSGSKLDFSTTKLVQEIGTYIYKVHIDQNYYVNFADAALASAQDAVRIFKFGALFKDEKILQFAAYVSNINSGAEKIDLGNINSFLNSLEVRGEFIKIKAAAPQLRYAWLSDIQILTARREEGNANGLFFAAKGGNNAESHNHNDVGNFVIYKDGTPMIVDAGVGVYTKQTFGPDRYKLWYMQSSWHNCPAINGAMQAQGKTFKAVSVKTETSDEITTLSMDIAHAYPEEAGVKFWKRTFTYNHLKDKVLIKENYSLEKFKQRSELNFLINGTVTFIKEGVLKLSNPQGKSISLIYDPNKFDYELEIKKIDDARLATYWRNDLNRLILKRKGKNLKGEHQIEFSN